MRRPVSGKKSYPLRTIFLIINLTVLALPVIGIFGLRIFENELHRQTETNLISEGAYVQTLYLSALSEVLEGATLEQAPVRFLPDAPPPLDDTFHPYLPQLDLLRDKVAGPAEPGKQPRSQPHAAAWEAGQRVQPILEKAQLQNLSAVRILDSNGVVVASTGAELGEDLSHRPEVARALSGHYCSVLREKLKSRPDQPLGSISRASRIWVFVAIPILEDKNLSGVVYLSRTSLSVTKALWDIRYAIAFAILLVVTMAISLILSYVVTRPIKSIIRQAERIAEGEQGISLEVSRSAPAEAHQLSSALSGMLKEIRARMEYIEEFTRNVSHEFKTPLTSIQGAVELLDEGWRDMTEEERSRFIAIIDSDVKRMNRLVGRLLELARIETAQPEDSVTDLNELLENLVRRYSDAGHPVTLEKRADLAPGRVAPDMAETLFTNLLDNAVTHGKGAKVKVIIPDAGTIVIQDKGPGISGANLPHIFERFFTTARDKSGTGLGLSMVRAIAEAYGLEIHVESGESGTSFMVTFTPGVSQE